MGRNLHPQAVLLLVGMLGLAVAAQAQTPPVVRQGARAGGRLSSDFGGGRTGADAGIERAGARAGGRLSSDFGTGRLRGGAAVRSRFSDRIPGVTRGRDFDPVTAPPVAVPATPVAPVVDPVTGEAVVPIAPEAAAPVEEVRETEVVVEETTTSVPPAESNTPGDVDRTRWNESLQTARRDRYVPPAGRDVLRDATRRSLPAEGTYIYDFRDSRGVLVLTPTGNSSSARRTANRPVLEITPR